MKILLCTLEAELDRTIKDALADDDSAVSSAPTLADAIRFMVSERPCLVAVGGQSPEAIATALRELRSIQTGQPAVLIALTDDVAANQNALLAAGADDLASSALDANVLRHRLLIAKQSAIYRAAYIAATDLTEARTDRRTLADLSESITTTFNSIGDGVIATDTFGAITRMNPVAEKLTLWPFAEARGRHLQEVLPIVNEDTRKVVESPVEEALREGAKIALPLRTMLVRRDGSEIPIADSCAPIKSTDGETTGAVLVFRDLSALREQESARAKLEKQLAFADRLASVGTLAAGVAHEINNPLTYVGVNVDMAVEVVRVMSGGSPIGRMRQLEEMLLDARNGVVRITKIVRGLKTFSRIEEERPRTIEIEPVIELSISMVANEIRHRATIVRVYERAPLVEADEARLSQVLINLLVNAAHAFPEGHANQHEIRIVTSTDARGHAVIEVRDNGPGIAPHIMDRLFDPFFTTKPIGIGTGLGLAVSRNIITSMHGDISVQSELGKGATFRLTLPASSAKAVSKGPASLAAGGRGARARVLVVDDEPAIGIAIRRVLSEHDVTAVTNAEDALRLLDGGQCFDVVLADLMMPGVSGMELYQSILERHSAIAPKVAFITGGAFTPEAHAFLDRVANRRLDKPFEPQKLRELIWDCVRGRAFAVSAG